MDFHGFRLYVFSTLRNEMRVIIYYYLIPCRLSTDPETTLADSEWLECSLYVTVLRFAILPSVIFFLLIYCTVCLHSGTARDPHRSAGSGVEFRIVIRRIFWNRRASKR